MEIVPNNTFSYKYEALDGTSWTYKENIQPALEREPDKQDDWRQNYERMLFHMWKPLNEKKPLLPFDEKNIRWTTEKYVFHIWLKNANKKRKWKS